MSFNIAIDGPAGAGKSTIAKKIARELNFIYVDTGAMYRAVTLYLMRQKIPLEDKTGIREACHQIRIRIEYQNGEQQVILNDENVTGRLRTEEVGKMTSAFAANAHVRAALLDIQRDMASKENIVMDGRDIGTHVLPDAQLKIYLTASPDARAMRRYLELQKKGINCSLDIINKDIIQRDKQDMNREIAPLKKAEDAILVDSSNMDIDQVVAHITALYQDAKIIVAKTAGFCFGVKRAVEKVYQQVESSKSPIYTFGPIIHNEEVVKDLESKGVKVIHCMEELRKLKNGTVIIRSHGVPENVCRLIRENGLELIDATCPYVKKIHSIVKRESNAGSHILIIGNADHPEVEGIKGWCNAKVDVIGTNREAENFVMDCNTPLCIVSQTTFNYNKFNKLVEIISKKGYDILVLNTICNATEKRQTEARAIAAEVNGMIVIGGSHSSNTQRLFEICKEECENTYYIQTLDDLDVQELHSMSCVGITAGASTPNNIIEEVQKNVRNEF